MLRARINRRKEVATALALKQSEALADDWFGGVSEGTAVKAPACFARWPDKLTGSKRKHHFSPSASRGEGVRPRLIPASDLAQLLVAAEQTVLAIAAREHPEAAEDLIVGLAQVRDESIGFAFASNRAEVALAAYTELGDGDVESGVSGACRAEVSKGCARSRDSPASMGGARSSGMAAESGRSSICRPSSRRVVPAPDISAARRCFTERSSAWEACGRACGCVSRSARSFTAM